MKNHAGQEAERGAAMNFAFCCVDGCVNIARRAGYCDSHCKRKAKGQVVSTPIKRRPQTALERLLEAAITYAETSSTDDVAWARAKDNLRKAAGAYNRDQAAPVARRRA